METKTSSPIYQNLGMDYYNRPFMDSSTSGVVYYGWSEPGSDETDACWRIMKKTTANGVTKQEFPNGKDEFSFKWSERNNYTYSR